MLGTMSMRQPENWLYEIWQKGQDSPCYVMVPNAKDLVKSHLMIAVREEVEVLKEKISELMDKINILEVENTILKSNMSPDMLQQLHAQTQLQIAGNSATGNNMITAPPTPLQNSNAVTAATPANLTTATVVAAVPPTAAVAATPIEAAQQTVTSADNETVAAAVAEVATTVEQPAVVVAATNGTNGSASNGPMS